MPLWFFVSDLHGRLSRYAALFAAIDAERPDAVFLGGDLMPSGLHTLTDGEDTPDDFVGEVLAAGFRRVRERRGSASPEVVLILGNDDARVEETALGEGEQDGLWRYAHNRRLTVGDRSVYGYNCVPPTPFRLKDWERYDVSRFVDVGCVSPEEGWRSVPVAENEVRYGTIAADLDALAGEDDLSAAVLLFHSPPYQCRLDRAALDGRMVDHAPLDVHVGSIAIRRFIEKRRPALALHGHVHESARLTGAWRDRIGPTHLFSAAHDGPELALVRFDPDQPEAARRELVG